MSPSHWQMSSRRICQLPSIISYMFCLFSVCCLSLLPEDGFCQRQTFLLKASLALQSPGILPRQPFLCDLVFQSDTRSLVTGRVGEEWRVLVKQMVFSTCLYRTWKSDNSKLITLESGHIFRFLFKFWIKTDPWSDAMLAITRDSIDMSSHYWDESFDSILPVWTRWPPSSRTRTEA